MSHHTSKKLVSLSNPVGKLKKIHYCKYETPQLLSLSVHPTAGAGLSPSCLQTRSSRSTPTTSRTTVLVTTRSSSLHNTNQRGSDLHHTLPGREHRSNNLTIPSHNLLRPTIHSVRASPNRRSPCYPGPLDCSLLQLHRQYPGRQRDLHNHLLRNGNNSMRHRPQRHRNTVHSHKLRPRHHLLLGIRLRARNAPSQQYRHHRPQHDKHDKSCPHHTSIHHPNPNNLLPSTLATTNHGRAPQNRRRKNLHEQQQHNQLLILHPRILQLDNVPSNPNNLLSDQHKPDNDNRGPKPNPRRNLRSERHRAPHDIQSEHHNGA